MVSELMVGNINEFIEAHWEANRFELLMEVASGLMYIHGKGMIHGDLKGANILIDEGSHARLADFGLLRIISDHTNFTTSNSVPAGGTTRWMSPELLAPGLFNPNHGRSTIESDCYAMGMVIYEVLTGRVPFPLVSNHVVSGIVIQGDRPQRPGEPTGAWFTDGLWNMLGLCWATEPQRRPGIGGVRECLERIASTWKPLRLQVNENVEKDEGDSDPAADFMTIAPTLITTLKE